MLNGEIRREARMELGGVGESGNWKVLVREVKREEFMDSSKNMKGVKAVGLDGIFSGNIEMR